jgi:hypothetical protein
VGPLAGRSFTSEETKAGSGGAALLSNALWQSRFGGRSDALGQTIHVFGKTLTVVGILPPGFQFPDKTDIWIPTNTIVPDAESRAGRENMAAPRFRTLLLAIFAGLAVCLAMAGVYGVLAYLVAQRTNEIGLRMALGANQGDVLRLIVRQGVELAAIGLTIGLAGSFAAARVLAGVLYDVKPTDPMTYAAVAGFLGLATLAASYGPARRATKIDPMIALRHN